MQVQLDVIGSTEAATGQLHGVGQGLRVLAYLAIVGVVLPLSLMANGAYALPAWLAHWWCSSS